GITQEGLAALDIFAQVETDVPEADTLVAAEADTAGARVELLQDLKLDGALGEHIVAVDADADVDQLGVAVLDAVVGDGALIGAATVLAVDAVRETPFDERHARNERDVVEVVDLAGPVLVPRGW